MTKKWKKKKKEYNTLNKKLNIYDNNKNFNKENSVLHK